MTPDARRLRQRPRRETGPRMDVADQGESERGTDVAQDGAPALASFGASATATGDAVSPYFCVNVDIK